jgi:hypothetical protein
MGSLSDASERMREKGTVGLFTKKAKAAGKSVGEFASEKSGSGGKLGKEANFAKMAKRHWKPLAKKA